MAASSPLSQARRAPETSRGLTAKSTEPRTFGVIPKSPSDVLAAYAHLSAAPHGLPRPTWIFCISVAQFFFFGCHFGASDEVEFKALTLTVGGEGRWVHQLKKITYIL